MTRTKNAKGRDVSEVLECGHVIDVRELKVGKESRYCRECTGHADGRRSVGSVLRHANDYRQLDAARERERESDVFLKENP